MDKDIEKINNDTLILTAELITNGVEVKLNLPKKRGMNATPATWQRSNKGERKGDLT